MGWGPRAPRRVARAVRIWAVWDGIHGWLAGRRQFALCFTLGSGLYMASFALLRGPAVHLASMMSCERLPFTTSYLTSMLGTLYASLVARSQILTIIMASAQFAALG